MSSALACAGLAVSGEEGFSWLLKNACIGIREIGTFDGVHVGRWQDDSGAALILGLHDGQIVDFTTTYTGNHAALADSPEKQSRARLSGTVLDATPDLCALTGQPFTADLCLAASDPPEVPEPGSIISGTAVLSAAIDNPILNTAQA